MKVLRLIGGLDPGHGGPAVSSMNSIIATQRAGTDITFAIPLEPSGRAAIEPAIAQLEQEGVSVITFDCATACEKLSQAGAYTRSSQDGSGKTGRTSILFTVTAPGRW